MLGRDLIWIVHEGLVEIKLLVVFIIGGRFFWLLILIFFTNNLDFHPIKHLLKTFTSLDNAIEASNCFGLVRHHILVFSRYLSRSFCCFFHLFLSWPCLLSCKETRLVLAILKVLFCFWYLSNVLNDSVCIIWGSCRLTTSGKIHGSSSGAHSRTH